MKIKLFAGLALALSALADVSYAQWSGYRHIEELRFAGTDEPSGIYFTLNGDNPLCNGVYHMSAGDDGYEQISELAKISFLYGAKIDAYAPNCVSIDGVSHDNLKQVRVRKF